MNKKISTPIAIGIILILAILVGGFTLSQYSKTQKELNYPLPEIKILEKKINKTADWETYTNENAEYSFQYPKDWNAATNKYNSKNALFGPGATDESGYGGVEYVGKLSANKSLINFVNDFNSKVEGYSGSESEYASINGDVVISTLVKASLEPTRVKIVSFEKNGNVFNMYLVYKTNFTQYPEDEQRLNVFNQMVFTFKSTSEKSQIKILSPNGGEVWTKGEKVQILWNASENIKSVNIRLAIQGNEDSQNFNAAIVSDIPNTGSYEWTVQELFTEVLGIKELPASDEYQVIVEDSERNNLYDTSDSTLSIR